MRAVVVAALAAGCISEAEPVRTRVELGPERGCADPADRELSGAYRRDRVDLPAASDQWNWGGGAVVADLDGDERPELLLAVESGLWLGRVTPEGVEVDREAFEGLDVSFPTGGSAADYDGDGDLDLYVTRTLGHPIPPGATVGGNRLLRNHGDGTFEDVTVAAGVDGCIRHHRTGAPGCRPGMSSSWGDLDRDGDLDLFVGQYGFVDQTDGVTQAQMSEGEPNAWYENLGDGTFEDRSGDLPIEAQDGYTYGAPMVDLDDDGDLDVYLVNDFGLQWPNRVLWNDGEGGLNLSPGDATGLERSMTGMGVAIGDLDGDARPDLVITEWGRNTLLLSGSGQWVDWAAGLGAWPDPQLGQVVGWGTELGDLDDDGDLDLLAAFGHLQTANTVWSNPSDQPDGAWLHEPDGDGWHFVDRSAALRLDDPGVGRGLALADVDGDGWLDPFVRDLDGPAFLHRARCGRNTWSLLRLRQPGTANVFAIGARVEVFARGRHLVRWIGGGGTSFASAGPPEVHVGLGGADTIDLVRVRWPDGIDTFAEHLPVGRALTLVREP